MNAKLEEMLKEWEDAMMTNRAETIFNYMCIAILCLAICAIAFGGCN